MRAQLAMLRMRDHLREADKYLTHLYGDPDKSQEAIDEARGSGPKIE